MACLQRQIFILLVIVTLGLCSVKESTLFAQSNRGFNANIKPQATSLELNDRYGHWAMEVTFKPMRMVRLKIKDSKTGETKEHLVWYMLYKAVNRPIVKLQNQAKTRPVNTEDPDLDTPYFIPEFTLVTNDNDGQQVYTDKVFPEAEAMILERELRGKESRGDYKNTVDIVQKIPATVTAGNETKQTTLQGVVIWTGIDPKTDYFTVYMSGFSSGYKKMAGEDGKQSIARRTIQQKFWRPGDEFDEDEIEFRYKDDPEWVYRPDPEPIK